MAENLSFDTTFLIDFQRERALRNETGPAHGFLRASGDTHLSLSPVALGEFAEGFESTDDDVLRLVRETHEILVLDEAVGLVYAQVVRRLRSEGRLIGTNDLWIAATSIRYDLPLVTADREHFSRIPGLRLRSYR